MKVGQHWRLLSAMGLLGALLGGVACTSPPTPPPRASMPEQTPAEAKPVPANPPAGMASPPQATPSSMGNASEVKEGNGKVVASAPGDPGEAIDATPSEPSEHAMTAREQVLELEEELEQTLREFDGVLLESRIAVKNEEKKKATDAFNKAERLYGRADAAGGGSETQESPPPLPPAAGSQQTQSTSGGGHQPPSPKARRGDYEHAAAGAPLPPDIPQDEDEEDVVARQLREAALQETDPDLRQKLWNEYRRYKGLPVKK